MWSVDGRLGSGAVRVSVNHRLVGRGRDIWSANRGPKTPEILAVQKSTTGLVADFYFLRCLHGILCIFWRW